MKTDRLPLQFGIRGVLAIMVLLSAVCAVVFSVPAEIASGVVIVSSMLLAAVFISAAIYGDGDLRAFCIGVMIPLAYLAAVTAWAFLQVSFGGFDRSYAVIIEELAEVASALRMALVGTCLTAPVAGMLSALVRRELQKRV